MGMCAHHELKLPLEQIPVCCSQESGNGIRTCLKRPTSNLWGSSFQWQAEMMFAPLHVRRYISFLYVPDLPPTTIGPLIVEIIL